ncbi:MAG: hypothetical protein E7357_03760 [Clostridiales bacterium]|nr:hypothetical protein [Clostridiales bacterium]
MKKITIAFLLSLCAAFSVAAVGCKDNDDTGNNGSGNNGENNAPAPAETCVVSLTSGEGYTVVGDGVTFNETKNCWEATAEKNSVFTFSIDLGAFYTGTPLVKANGVALAADSNGQYALPIDDDTNVSIEGIYKEQSNMAGTGAFDDAYVVSRPIDLIHIAEQVNAGKGNYARAYYVLANDIDCKGEEIGVIGTAENPFSGCFTCLTNPETGEMERYTISNFKINATDKNYVGLFGCVQVDMSVTSSGLFYGVCIDNFEINASTAKLAKFNRNIYCGGLIGYGLGTRLYLCDATNGTINLSADPTEFSFTGGLIGVQQSMYVAEYQQYYTAETAYATVDVDVNVVSGTTLYAGGIVGYLYTNSFVSPSFIHNSYSTGNVNGAIRTGGIAGGLGQYSSIATCYSSGNVTADVKLTANTDGYLPEHCIAYAGGIAGFAENDTVVNDCFAVGTITAKAVDGESAQKTHHAIGGGDEDGKISVASRKYVIRDCLGEIDKSTMSTTLQGMGWQTYNWVLSDTDYPVINYEASDESVTIKTVVQFVDKQGNEVTVQGKNNTEYSYADTYAPIANAFVDGFLDLYLTADNKSLSFGYYFDKECTQPVPYSYISTRESVLYMGFTSPADIVGTYSLAVKDSQSPLIIDVRADGTVACADGVTSTEANYQYDGDTLIIEGARLARYFTGKIDTEQTVNQDAIFDMYRYDTYYFKAVKTENGLQLFDGTYFTAEKPLLAYAPTQFTHVGARYTDDGVSFNEYVFLPDGTGTKNGRNMTYTYANGVVTINGTATIDVNDLKTYDALKGTWQKSAFTNKEFTFDGIDRWEAYYNVYTRNSNGSTSSKQTQLLSGTYETTDGTTFLLKNGLGEEYATVTFAGDGFLQVTYANGKVETYSSANGYVGKWKGYGVEMQLFGINKNGIGNATVNFTNLNVTYDLTYKVSETLSPAAYLCLYYQDTLFGYFTHDVFTNSLQATLFDPTSMEGGYLTYPLQLVNGFDSVWISDETAFDDIYFDGTGNYDRNGDWVGTVIIGGEKTTYLLENGGLNGYFDYQGVRYEIVYDDDNSEIKINVDTTLKRKDELADIDFVSVDENHRVSSFQFDGKGKLLIGGKMTVTLAGDTPTDYVYKADGEQFAIYNGNVQVGTIVLNESKACYDITLNGVNYTTYIRNEFMGNWAMSGEFHNEAFVIGATDLDGYIHATFRDYPVKIEKLDTDYYSFYCEVDYMPITYYLYVLYDNATQEFDSFALSEYTSLVYGDYILCSHVDAMQGTWTQNGNPDFTISFDGVQSSYSNGTATLSYKGYATPYLYRIYTDKNGNVESVMLWSQTSYNGKTLYYKLTPTSVTTEGAFVLGDKAYIRAEVDALYKMSAKDENGYTYTFDGGNLNDDVWGVLTATKDGAATRTLTYDIVSFNNDNTATLTVKETVDGKAIIYTATLDYNDSTNVTISFVEQ